MTASLPRLYQQGYTHAIADAAGSLRRRLNSLRHRIKYAPAAERRVCQAIANVLQHEVDFISKMVTNQAERLERNMQDGT